MHYALNGKYPIETEEQVKTASDYFSRYLQRFAPMDRVAAATNIEKRATVLDINVNEGWITNYSRPLKPESTYSPDFDANIKLRKEACVRTSAKVEVNGKMINATELLKKVAMQRKELPGIAMMKSLQEFDKLANLEQYYDNDVIDPAMTVFGSLNNPRFDSVKIAKDLTNYDLIEASRDVLAMEKISNTFGERFSEKFKKEPIKIASDLGPPEKSLLSETISK